ncbi:DNA (cytosine-5-)-methyltransferase [Myroides odoratus]|uniref:DNA (cytosine-5-)-methyltransferase n=1 Tax=Myroides odoratus TaxID=256 RepID=A0A9Q7EA95_MYROD|nr:DNA (cytosine-5-)-methyltransferase [Myroides odoratus]EHQ41517.1 DNA-cytosine methyltransferase [Myroides odoratus DSM 2801]EKB02690.1 DNA (cytosine-5-)-methyltransferase [Myroides odoratus CIP 103059]QQT98939.1 DNA (cytosine-5-)-methyltransferase [Myroides odoratus]WQD58874.1 DNA (cytosine-5-)-methyltransferase [Myroides odoratus]STZ28780.1 Modification methylase HpaII [Myroides odoratus]
MQKLKVGSDFSGVGAFDQALLRLEVDYESVFACDMDSNARHSFILNYGTEKDLELLTHPYVIFCNKMYGSFSKHGNFKKQTYSDVKKLARIQDEAARLFSFYYPWNVKYRKESAPLDIYMTSPPCQAFSLAGKRKGEEDKRGVLFYNSHEFIQKNKPRYFIFENVKGLLSDDGGKTFQRWIDFLGGKSVNGNPVIFPHEESVPYHIYYKVLNAKNYGVPQNRERIFIVGIRDDQDNNFSFPVEIELKKRLKDILETDVDEKYFLSDKLIDFFISHTEKHKQKGNGFSFKPKDIESIGQAVTTKAGTRVDDNYIYVKSANSKGYEIAEEEEDSINFEHPNSETRRGRVGKGVAQTLTTSCNQGIYSNLMIRKLTPRECFRLMDFPDSFKWNVSDSQAYKQAGNSIVVAVLAAIIQKLNLNEIKV